MKKLLVLLILFSIHESFAQSITLYSGCVEGPDGFYLCETGLHELPGPGNYNVTGDFSIYPEPYFIRYGVTLYPSGGGYFDLHAIIALTDGASFTPSVASGSSNQAIGRFHLRSSGSGATLVGTRIKLIGVRTGISNFKLWFSTDDSFHSGSDTQLGSTVSDDPGNYNDVEFSGFSSDIPVAGTYYFLTCDISADATGDIKGETSNSNLGFTWGFIPGDDVLSPLSSADVSLPVELACFNANAEDGQVNLHWITESEIENLGFNIYRSLSKTGNYQKINDQLIPGAGTSSHRHDYEYADKDVSNGVTYWYKIEDVDYSGNTKLQGSISATPVAKTAPPEFILHQNKPNPFNPVTTISYQIAEPSFVKLSIYDIGGRRIETLVNEPKNAGYYSATWNAHNTASGIYIYRIDAGKFSSVKKCLVVK